jgi:DNA-binding NarL/FixJ family response regulator
VARPARGPGGDHRSAARRTGHEPAVAAARAALGEAGFDAARAAGWALPVEAAVAEARAALAAPAPPPAAETEGGLQLTGRERDVLRLLAEGRTDREIAAALFVSPRTVGWHVTHLLAKLGVESRTAAAALALRRGLV